VAKLDIDEIRAAARGRWGSILYSLAPHLAPALERPGKHVDCPIHKGKNDFRVFKDYEETGGAVCTCNQHMKDGFSVLMWANCWDFKSALYAVADYLGFDTTGKTHQYDWRKNLAHQEQIDRRMAEKKQEQEKEDERCRIYLNRIWQETIPATEREAEPLRLYLARRGLSAQSIPKTLRFHRNLSYAEDGKVIGSFPAIIALVQAPDGSPVTLHRIYITADGKKAPVAEPKKLMAYPSNKTLKGAAIRLGLAGSVLGVTEGVETGLAIQQATGMPVWASISAVLMEQIEIPDTVELACIYADKDRSETGHNSALKLITRLWQQGVRAVGMKPDSSIPESEKGIDWLDIFVQHGPDAIPNYQRAQSLLEAAASTLRRSALQ
jgi:phage/plasmid primase-like uncharacterized protein